MSDVLDNERGPAPRWVVPATMLAVVALVAGLAWRWSSSADTAAPTPSPSPIASPTLPAPSIARDGCGGVVELPLINAVPVPPSTGLRILLGDRDLRMLDVDAATERVLATRNDRRSFVGLTQTANEILTVLRNTCTVEGYGNGLVAAVNPDHGSVRPLGAGEAVLPGEPPTILEYDSSNTSTLVRPLGSAAWTPVPTGWDVYARTANGYFMSVSGSGDTAPDVGVGSVSVKSARLTKTFGAGPIVAASPKLVFWLAGDCPGVRCLLTSTTVQGVNTAQAIDTFACCGSVSPDGMKMAFRKTRASGQLGEHPGPPNDIAILDRTQGGAPLTILPGLVLPPKAGVTLTWSPDSQWLVIGADLGTGPAILIWRPGMKRPARVPVAPTLGGTTGPPALLVLAR